MEHLAKELSVFQHVLRTVMEYYLQLHEKIKNCEQEKITIQKTLSQTINDHELHERGGESRAKLEAKKGVLEQELKSIRELKENRECTDFCVNKS